MAWDPLAYQSYLETAATAIAAADYETAERNALAAMLLLQGTPDSEKGDEKIRWQERAANVEALLARVAKLKGAAAGMQITRLNYGSALGDIHYR